MNFQLADIFLIGSYIPSLAFIFHFWPLYSKLGLYISLLALIFQAWPIYFIVGPYIPSLADILHFWPLYSKLGRYISLLALIFQVWPLYFIIGPYIPSLADISHCWPLYPELGLYISLFFQIFSFQLDGIKLLSLLTVVNTLMIIFFTASVTKWIRGKNEKPIMYIGFILFGVGYAFLAFSNNIPAMFGAVILLSIGELIYVPTRQSLLAEIVEFKKRCVHGL